MDVQRMIAARAQLSEARFTGALTVRNSDGSLVTYRSDAEMRQAIADLDRMIAEAGGQTPVSTIRISTSKGF